MDYDDIVRWAEMECHKTGRSYKAPVIDEGDNVVVDTTCPYCYNRGAQAVADDIRQKIEAVERRM